MSQTKAELIQTKKQGAVSLGDADSSHSIKLKAPATVAADRTWTLPALDPTANQVLGADASTPTNLEWKNSVLASTATTKGDVLAATGSAVVTRLGVGANDTVLTADSSEATGLKWASAGGGAFTKIYRKTTTTSTAMNSGNDPVQVGGASMEITFTPPASTTSYLAHYSGQIHSGTDDGQWAPQFRISDDDFSSHTSINFVHNTYGFEDTEKQRRQENWWREFKPGSTSEWKIRIYAEVHSSEGVDITFAGWGGVNALTLYELVDSAKSGDWG
tara:strand:- start:6253 stop:7074 length:822 start_codon:yes stop_codon:yes gene_type:complete